MGRYDSGPVSVSRNYVGPSEHPLKSSWAQQQLSGGACAQSHPSPSGTKTYVHNQI